MNVRKMRMVLALDFQCDRSRRPDVNDKIKDLLVVLGLAIAMCVVFGVELHEPVFLWSALALLFVALGAMLAERVMR